MRIRFARKFRKQYDKADKKIRIAFDKKLTLFLQNPYSTQLNNHQLLVASKAIEVSTLPVTGVLYIWKI